MRFVSPGFAGLAMLFVTSQLLAQGVGTRVDSNPPARAAAPAAIRSTTSSRRIVGVFDDDSGDPVADAEVVDLIGGTIAHTESHGLIELSQFHNQNDSAVVQIRKIGYADTSLIVMVGRADTVPLQINLHHAATALETMISNATATPTLEGRQLQEFEDHRKLGIGHFMDGAELRKSVDNHSFVNYLASHFPSLSVTAKAKANDPTYLASGRGGCGGPAMRCGAASSACLIAIYIDGVALYVPGRGMQVPDLEDYRSEDFAAVEWYPGAGTVPAKYSTTGATCGVLLLWRKYS
jgi:hypothetical protein